MICRRLLIKRSYNSNHNSFLSKLIAPTSAVNQPNLVNESWRTYKLSSSNRSGGDHESTTAGSNSSYVTSSSIDNLQDGLKPGGAVDYASLNNNPNEDSSLIEAASGLAHQDIAKEVYDVLGFCPETQKVRPGLLAEATMPEIRAKLIEMLIIHGTTPEEAVEIVDAAWEERGSHTQETLVSLHNLKSLFESLKKHGVKIAVCTADSRDGTIEALQKLELSDLVDMVVCGDDYGTEPKPSPHNALKICDFLGVKPEDAFMVGDTLADMGMGKSAQLGGTIGVLSGVASEKDLEPFADHLVADVGSLLPIVLRKQKQFKLTNIERSVTGKKGPAAVRKMRDYLTDRYGGSQTPERDLVNKLVREPKGKWQKLSAGDATYKVPRRKFSSYSRAAYSSYYPGLFASIDSIPVDSTTQSSQKSSTMPTMMKRIFGSRSEAGLFTQQRRTIVGLPKREEKMTHIIVGAGSAGCVLANRLSEDKENKVLLLEYGKKDPWWQWKIHMPAALMYNLCDDKYNYFYHTRKEPSMNNRSMYWPRGKVWGGSSSLNAMVYIRGHPFDYDRWATTDQCKGWSYSECLPYFKKSETLNVGGDDYRGSDGPLHVTRGECKNPLYQAFIEAGVQAGYGHTKDMNGYRNEGVGPMDMTIHNGKRWSSSQAYLHPALDRPNLWAASNAFVSNLVFDGKRAIGVEYVPYGGHGEPIRSGMREKVYAISDVILCGGAINTPQLMMVSGIGPPDHLFNMKVPLLHALPGVGQNLQDHLEVYVQNACTQPITLYDKSSWQFPVNMVQTGLQWFYNQTGNGASNHLEAGGFVRTKVGKATHPDIQFHFLPSTVTDHGRVNGDQHAYQVHVGPMRPTSRGSLELGWTDPRRPPRIHANYLTTEQDKAEFRESVRIARDVFAQSAFDEFRGGELAPGPKVETDEEIDEFLREKSDSAYHPSCTCKMGPASDPMAVVDPKTMKVHGVDGLRIVDASVMPSIVSGNLNGPTIMVAEKAADIIRGKTPLTPARVPVWTHNGDVISEPK